MEFNQEILSIVYQLALHKVVKALLLRFCYYGVLGV